MRAAMAAANAIATAAAMAMAVAAAMATAHDRQRGEQGWLGMTDNNSTAHLHFTLTWL